MMLIGVLFTVLTVSILATLVNFTGPRPSGGWKWAFLALAAFHLLARVTQS